MVAAAVVFEFVAVVVVVVVGCLATLLDRL